MVFPLVGLRELSWSQWLRDEQVTWQGLVGTGVWGKEVWQDRLRSHRAVAAVFVEWLSADTPEADVSLPWALELTLWREESREPVSHRKSSDGVIHGVFGLLTDQRKNLFPGCDKQHVPGEKPGARQGS